MAFPPVEGLEDSLVLDHESAVGELRGQADDEGAEHVAAAWGVLVGHEAGVPRLDVEVLVREKQDEPLLSVMEQAWERMVTRRMYITGGLGAAPHIEGFGSDYELDPEYAYNETCASLASLFWNWEMVLLTQNARYSAL